MAQTKLWNRYSIFRQLILVLLIMSTIVCRADDKPVGMTLLFQSAGMPERIGDRPEWHLLKLFRMTIFPYSFPCRSPCFGQ